MRLEIYLLPGPFLLPRRHERLIPYYEQPIEPSTLSGPRKQSSPLKKRIIESYRALVERIPLHERLCAALVSATEIKVLYPDTVSREEAQHGFQHFLLRQHSKNKFWLGVDAVLAGLGAPLFLLPGPNVFFLFPAVRAFSHHRAVAGIRAANKKDIVFEPNASLGKFRRNIQGRRKKNIAPLVERLAKDLSLGRLPEFYQKVILHKQPREEDRS